MVKELIDAGISVKTAQLSVADYVLSGGVGVELKKVPDFVASIIDGRILEQVRDLKNSFPKAVLVIEGEEDIYSVRKVHANAIRGMLASIVLDFHVPVLYTKILRILLCSFSGHGEAGAGQRGGFLPACLKT